MANGNFRTGFERSRDVGESLWLQQCPHPLRAQLEMHGQYHGRNRSSRQCESSRIGGASEDRPLIWKSKRRYAANIGPLRTSRWSCRCGSSCARERATFVAFNAVASLERKNGLPAGVAPRAVGRDHSQGHGRNEYVSRPKLPTTLWRQERWSIRCFSGGAQLWAL